MIKKIAKTKGLMKEIRKIKEMNSATVHNCTFPFKIAEYSFLQVQRLYNCQGMQNDCYIYEFRPKRSDSITNMKYIIERMLEVTYFRPFQSMYAFQDNGNAVILFNSVSIDGRKFQDKELYQIAEIFDAA